MCSCAGSGKVAKEPEVQFAQGPPNIKLITIGNSGVGKTQLATRFFDGEFAEFPTPTIGADFRIRRLELEGKECNLVVWDTAGQEKYRSIGKAYFRGAHGVMLVFDVNDRRSFEGVRPWWEHHVTWRDSEDVVAILVGNKTDLQREVSHEEGQGLADELGIAFVETSARTDSNVDKAFMDLARAALASPVSSNQQPPRVVVKK